MQRVMVGEGMGLGAVGIKLFKKSPLKKLVKKIKKKSPILKAFRKPKKERAEAPEPVEVEEVEEVEEGEDFAPAPMTQAQFQPIRSSALPPPEDFPETPEPDDDEIPSVLPSSLAPDVDVQEEEKSEGGSVLPYVIGGAVLLGGALYLALSMKKKRKK